MRLLLVLMCVAVPTRVLAQGPVAPDRDRTAPRMEQPPPHPPPDFQQLPRAEDRDPVSGEPGPSGAQADVIPPPRVLVECARAFWPTIQNLTTANADALIRGLAAEDQNRSLRAELQKFVAMPKPAGPGAPQPVQPPPSPGNNRPKDGAP